MKRDTIVIVQEGKGVRSKGDSKNGRREGNGKGTNLLLCLQISLCRLRDQERKQDLCCIGCAATAEYTGSTTRLVFDK